MCVSSAAFSSASVSTVTLMRCVTSKSASLRIAWTWLTNSRAKPSATSSGLSVVSSATTVAPSEATTSPAFGARVIMTSSRAISTPSITLGHSPFPVPSSPFPIAAIPAATAFIFDPHFLPSVLKFAL